MSGGWGSSLWGSSLWGGAAPTGVAIQEIAAVAENVLRVAFNRAIYFSQVLDVPDASNPDLWQVTPVGGTVGYDGAVARPVSVVRVDQGTLEGSPNGSVMLLSLDRPMTPWPARYAVATTAPVYSVDLAFDLPAGPLGDTPAVFRGLAAPDPSAGTPGRDLVNPQSFSGAQESTIAQPQQAALGSFGFDGSGDYAIDARDTGLKKRLARRLFTRRDGFVHLPGYGVGIRDYAKRLSRSATRAQLAAACEAQFSQEPEVAQVQVLTRLDAQDPSLLRLSIFVKKKSGQTAKYSLKFPVQ